MQIKNTRTCIITREKSDPSNLIRIAKVNGKLMIDIDNKLKGRGYYISKNLSYSDDLIKRLKKSLKGEVSSVLAKEIEEVLKNYGIKETSKKTN